MSFTFVTALYNISREQYDNRSYEQYQEWFKKTLTIPVPMVIYTEICNESIIEESRKGLPTKVIYTTLQETPFYYTRDKVKYIINESNFKKKIQNPNILENRCYDYIPIVNSKFIWMSQSIQNNYFNTEMFYWIDAGLSRFLKFDLSDGNFNRQLIEKINIENKLFFQIGRLNEFNMFMNNNLQLNDIIGKNINLMMGGFWGGNKDLILEICNKGSKIYLDEFIKKEQVENEQVAFSFILKDYKEQIIAISPHSFDCANYYLFCGKI